MNVYIPIATGYQIECEVFDAIHAQTVRACIVVCDTPAIDGNRRQGEENSRNKCRMCVCDEEFYIMQDANAILYSHDVYERMISLLLHDDAIDVVCLNKMPGLLSVNDHHYDIGVMACRGHVAEVPFVHREPDRCLCDQYRRDLEAHGYTIRYLDTVVRYHKHNH